MDGLVRSFRVVAKSMQNKTVKLSVKWETNILLNISNYDFVHIGISSRLVNKSFNIRYVAYHCLPSAFVSASVTDY